MPLTLDTYRQLGRSGLRVSPLALGAATFGNDLGWGAEKDEARRLFDHYVERGGNFIDTTSQVARLDEVSAIDLGQPHTLLASDHIRVQTRGDLKIQARR